MNEAAFLNALHESPDDEVTWLALADFLDEAGQADRAELVRLLRRLRTLPVMPPPAERAGLEARVVALVNAGTRPLVAEVVNSVDMRLALLPAGRVRMGSVGESLRDENEVIHQAEVAQPFYLGVFTVTQGQFQRVTGREPSYYRAGGANTSEVAGLDTSDFPVEGVTWADAVAFCQALSRRKAEKAAGRKYRLPTEVEWEYACRAAGTSLDAFAFGPTLSSRQANFDGKHPFGTKVKGPHLNRTTTVGSYLPNAWGLYDMHGNVWEWCQDLYGTYPNLPPRRRRGTSPARGNRVVRGGAYYNYAAWCRSARRCSVSESHKHGNTGFRVAAEITSPGASDS